MNRVSLPLLLLFTLLCFYAEAGIKPSVKIDTALACDTLLNQADSIKQVFYNNPDVLQLVARDSTLHSKFKEKKFLAAILAFPVPFGLLGLHRVFLGTKPYIPFVYMGTLGGCFLILPIMDFIAILSADEETFKRFENNPKVFMWPH